MIHAESVTVDDDEGRYILIINTYGMDHLRIDIHDVVLEFYDQVRKEIGPYAAEAASARAAVRSGVTLAAYTGAADDQDSGYALDDPKHPTFHERMVD